MSAATDEALLDLMRAVVETLVPPQPASGHYGDYADAVSDRRRMVLGVLQAATDYGAPAGEVAERLRQQLVELRKSEGGVK